MSYARFGEGSDVYVFLACEGHLECCGCILQEREWVDDPNYPIIHGYLKPVGEIVLSNFHTTAEMLAHLDQHRAAGHTVADETYEELRADAAENDAWIASGVTSEGAP